MSEDDGVHLVPGDLAVIGPCGKKRELDAVLPPFLSRRGLVERFFQVLRRLAR